MLPLKILKVKEFLFKDVVIMFLETECHIKEVQKSNILLFGDNLVDFADFSKTSEWPW